MIKKILIVDDQPENLQAIASLFKERKYPCEIMKAPNGIIALKLIKKKLPDLIITDWEMPQMDGIEFIKQLRSKNYTVDIPVIMCTGVMTTSENLQTALEAGASDYIRKPVDKIELIARTTSMLKLAESQHKIKVQNIELEQQKEEIQTINDSLYEKQDIITKQKLNLEDNFKQQKKLNQQLSATNIELEELVQKLKQSEITIKKKNNQLLKLSHVVSHTDNAVMIIDKTGEIEWINKGFTKLYGFTLEEFTCINDNILHNNTNSYVNSFIKDAIDNKKTVMYEVEVLHKNNSKLWIQTTWSPVVDEKGDLLNLVAIDSDITSIKKAQHKIKEQNKHITDSINYAKRIQYAILPSKTLLDEILPQHFILFKPRDIVSGDFYWMRKVDKYIMIAAADCTGHGVPGAFMSMLGISFLNEIVRKHELMHANLILDELRNQIKTTLDQTGKDNEAKDGMDIAFCIIDTETNKLQFAGAYNPLYIIRNTNLPDLVDFQNLPDLQRKTMETNNFRLTRVNANNQPIGVHLKEIPFTNNEIQLLKGDKLYISSDGFIDQIGGNCYKKFLSKNFKKLLLNIHTEPMSKQHTILNQTIEDWKNLEEQVDDILIIGFEV